MKLIRIPPQEPELRERMPPWLKEIICRFLSLFHLLVSIFGILLALFLWRLGLSPAIWWQLRELRRTRP